MSSFEIYPSFRSVAHFFRNWDYFVGKLPIEEPVQLSLSIFYYARVILNSSETLLGRIACYSIVFLNKI